MLKTKFILNENIGIKTFDFLISKNYNVKSTIKDFRGISDRELLEIARKENRIIITLDKDFCELVFRDHLSCCGIILLKLRDESPNNINKFLEAFLDDIKEDIKDKFVVITEGRIRIRQIK